MKGFKLKRCYLRLICFVLAFISLILAIGTFPRVFAAAVSADSNVLSDLRGDENFDIGLYPANSDDYSISVIQVAESTSGRLFVYTYQPCQNSRELLATSITFSLSDKIGGIAEDDIEMSEEDRVKEYNLTLINKSGVFCKYVVDDFTVSKAEKRFYNLVSVIRGFIEDIDEETTVDNIVNGKAYAVGRLYTATTVNGKIEYACEDRNVIEILNPYVNFIRYNDGFILNVSACDSHYVAFDTDIKIDELYEADLKYSSRSVHKYHKAFTGNVVDYGDFVENYVYLTDDQHFTEKATGWLFGQNRDYDRIMTVTDFLAAEGSKLDSTQKKGLDGKKWVLRFAETDYSYKDDGHDGNRRYTEVSEVMILRLCFKSDGVVYNLGAVSDKVSYDYDYNPPFNFWEWLANLLGIPVWSVKLIIFGIIAVLLLGVLLPVLSAVFPAFGQVVLWIVKGLGYAVKYLFIGLWYVISSPVRLIIWIVRKKRGEE